ncbi:MAG: hypothetical protein IT160_11645 [Bryobacterales bacterium]|nr:hypothetical protein [Bryobacterales bacterium]
MTSAIPLLRLLLVALATFFGVGLGRCLAVPSRPRLITWILRIAVTLFGVCWYRVDLLAIAAFLLAAAGVAAGYHQGKRPPRQDHLEDVIFPKK